MSNNMFIDSLRESFRYFIQHNGSAYHSDGFKLSIQGNSLTDAKYLYDKLIDFLLISKCSFKFGTSKLISCDNVQQSKKLLTIYIPNGVEVKSFAELIYLHIKDYEGGNDITKPDSYEHYKNAIYFRNDRDEDGTYISAN
tara:strand:+ start:182 stop:601 length:420 start_codon:yes stop_codon:yes gene_type:complete